MAHATLRNPSSPSHEPPGPLVTGELGNRDEYNLGIYAYDRAFTMPPSYGVGSALALILTVILLIITIGYVRASVRQGAIR